MKLFVFLSALLVTLQLSGCGKSEPPALRIGVSGSSSDVLFEIADKYSFFKQEKQGVKLTRYASAAEAGQALAKGELDAISGNPVEVIKLYEKYDWQPKIVWALGYDNGLQVLLGRPGINQLSDLRGKRLAYQTSKLDALGVFLALQTAKLKLSDIRPVDLPAAALASALRDGQSDTVWLSAQQAGPLLAQQQASKLFDSSQSPEALIDVIVSDEKWLLQHGPDLDKMLRALGRASKVAPPQAGWVRLGRAQQNNYFVAGGRLADALFNSDAALRAHGQVSKTACGRLCLDTRALDLPSE